MTNPSGPARVAAQWRRTRHRKARALDRAASGVLVGAPLLAAAGVALARLGLPTPGIVLGASGLGALTLAAVGMLAQAVSGVCSREREGALGACALGLGFFPARGGAWSLPWHAIARIGTAADPRGEGTELRVETLDGDLWQATLEPGPESRGLILAARKAVACKALVVPLRAPEAPWATRVSTGLVLLVAALLAPSGVAVALWILVLCVWLPALVARLQRQRERRAVVGSDGVEVVTDGTRRFVPFASLAGVDWDECGVLLRRNDGEELALPLVSPEDLRAPDEVDATTALSRRDLLLERCSEGLAAWRGRPDTEDAGGTGSLLDRQGRDPEAWRDKLQALAHDAGGAYRRAALDEATVASVLEDPHASVERRVAAAWTLGSHEDPETRQRVRVAVESCASAPAREALSRAAARDLDELTLELMLEANAERAG